MQFERRRRTGIVLVAGLLFGAPALAAPPEAGADPSAAGPDVAKAKEQARLELERALRRQKEEAAKAAAELRGSIKTARARSEVALGEAKQAIEQAGQQIQSAVAAMADAGSRTEHIRQARHDAWQLLAPIVRLGSEIPPDARQELGVHSRRMARLARVRALAEYARDGAAIKRVDKLTEREQARHGVALARVWPALTDPKARTGVPDEAAGEARPRSEEEEDQEVEP